MTIEERFEKLENEVRTLREQKGKLRRLSLASIALALAALIGGTALSVRAYTGAIEPAMVTTQAILIKDSANQIRLAFGAADGGIISYDKNGKKRVALNSAGMLVLYDVNEKARVALDSFYGNVRLSDGMGIPRVNLGANGSVIVYDAAGKTRTSLGDSGYVTAHDSNGVVRVYLNAADNKIYFKNASGGTVAAHP